MYNINEYLKNNTILLTHAKLMCYINTKCVNFMIMRMKEKENN